MRLIQRNKASSRPESTNPAGRVGDPGLSGLSCCSDALRVVAGVDGYENPDCMPKNSVALPLRRGGFK